MSQETSIVPASWICDACGERITNAQSGWIEWLVKTEQGRARGYGLRLVHTFPSSPQGLSGCQYDDHREFLHNGSSVSDDLLENFTGPAGLSRFLDELERGVIDKNEVVEMIRRIHIPGYEEARSRS